MFEHTIVDSGNELIEESISSEENEGSEMQDPSDDESAGSEASDIDSSESVEPSLVPEPLSPPQLATRHSQPPSSPYETVRTAIPVPDAGIFISTSSPADSLQSSPSTQRDGQTQTKVRPHEEFQEFLFLTSILIALLSFDFW